MGLAMIIGMMVSATIFLSGRNDGGRADARARGAVCGSAGSRDDDNDGRLDAPPATQLEKLLGDGTGDGRARGSPYLPAPRRRRQRADLRPLLLGNDRGDGRRHALPAKRLRGDGLGLASPARSNPFLPRICPFVGRARIRCGSESYALLGEDDLAAARL